MREGVERGWGETGEGSKIMRRSHRKRDGEEREGGKVI